MWKKTRKTYLFLISRKTAKKCELFSYKQLVGKTTGTSIALCRCGDLKKHFPFPDRSIWKKILVWEKVEEFGKAYFCWVCSQRYGQFSNVQVKSAPILTYHSPSYQSGSRCKEVFVGLKKPLPGYFSHPIYREILPWL